MNQKSNKQLPQYSKLTKLTTLRHTYSTRLSTLTASLASSTVPLSPEELDSRRLDAGLFCLQTIDVILAWLIAEDGGAAQHIRTLLAEHDEGFEVLEASLTEQMDGIEEGGEGTEIREMLGALVGFLT